MSADPYYNLGNRVIGLYEINVPNAWSIMQANNLYVYCGNNPIICSDYTGLILTPQMQEFVIGLMKEAHFSRNENNINLPETQNDAKDAGWNDGVAANCHQFTAEAGENVKYVSPDGKREAIYDSNGILVTSDEDVGTYNYIPSGNVFESVGHFFVDILPWIIWGNSEKDPTLPGDRFASMFGG